MKRGGGASILQLPSCVRAAVSANVFTGTLNRLADSTTPKRRLGHMSLLHATAFGCIGTVSLTDVSYAQAEPHLQMVFLCIPPLPSKTAHLLRLCGDPVPPPPPQICR